MCVAIQVKQLTKLIEVTRTDLAKPDRQKVMNMITIDAHSRDMVLAVAEAKADQPDCFQWVSQLRSYWDNDIADCRIRICDASFPYGYEYLGNGARLVITPLTDRIYITATQVGRRLLQPGMQLPLIFSSVPLPCVKPVVPTRTPCPHMLRAFQSYL